MDKLLLSRVALAMAWMSPNVYAAETQATLAIGTTTCPGGTQGQAYAGCTIAATGGTPPYTYSIAPNNYPPLPEGLSINSTTGRISSAQIGGQGTYQPDIIVTDSTGAQANRKIAFAINGANKFLATIFPQNSIFHHRMDAATTGLPVDTSPAAPIYVGYRSTTVKPFFGNTLSNPFPFGMPAFSVPYNQPNVAMTTIQYQNMFSSGPIPANAPIEHTSRSTVDRHVLIYRSSGGGNPPALYEIWLATYNGGPWIDSANAVWPNVNTAAMTPQGQGWLTISPFLVNADEVIGSGTAAAPNGTIRHPIRFTQDQLLNYWVWPSTQGGGVGSCINKGGATIPGPRLIYQSVPPASCTMTGPEGEIYRLKASIATPACVSTSPQAAIIITGLRNYGAILADAGSTGLMGTPDARWNDADLNCLTSLTWGDFEPVNVSSLIVNYDSGFTNK